jgi:hypothetical protein
MEEKKMRKILPILIMGILVQAGLGAAAFSPNVISQHSQSAATDSYDMIIIAPTAFSKSLQPLIDHKNTIGIQTILLKTEDIYKDYTGRDTAEQVKYAIKEAKEQWNITYVLLVGGLKPLGFGWYVPVRYSNLDDGAGYNRFLTDLYFADLYKQDGTFDDWDSNGDGVFAEWGKDTLDLTPDVAIGRLPCRTNREVSNIVQKIITYETETAGSSWFNRMVAVGGDTFPAYAGYEGEETCDVATSYMTNFTIEKLYTSTGALTGPADIVNAVDQGCGFLMTRGKGGTDRLRMGLPEDSELIAFQNKDVSKFANKGQYPICVLGECIHAKFDVCVLNLLKVLQNVTGYTQADCLYECIAWKLVREKDAGMIAVLTNTNICYGATGDVNHNGVPDDAEQYGGFLAVELFRLYSQEGIAILGQLYQQALTNYVNTFPVHTNNIHSKSVQEFILFGDPSLRIGGYP